MGDIIQVKNNKFIAQGDVAGRLLANNMNPNALRTNTVLRKDEWKTIDQSVLDVHLDRLVGVQDLISRGLTFQIGDGLGSTVLESENVDDVSAAVMSMSPVVKGQNDAVNFELEYLPLPIVHKDFQIDIRKLTASRKRGEALDTTLARKASRKVSEKIETVLFNGSSTYSFGGGTIYGYTDFPTRNTATIPLAWTGSAKTGELILADVLDWKQALINDNMFGPYILYIPTNYETVLDGEFKLNSDLTIRERLMKLDGIADIKVIDKLTASNIVLVQMTDDTIRMVNGLNLTTVQWESNGGFLVHFKVMQILVPQIRADSSDNCGVLHASL